MSHSAADLLTSEALATLKVCPGGPDKACGFIFLAGTKNPNAPFQKYQWGCPVGSGWDTRQGDGNAATEPHYCL